MFVKKPSKQASEAGFTKRYSNAQVVQLITRNFVNTNQNVI